eukprot:CAMPEP_0113487240 /NCGR_PEP_ID=MMETSP0014_2-20120614/25406_1 /TAXON_ID=2857 /ORGANISM="Nitzschia sp." /LENGTH=422 /DNA_ID=CAMNT_0000380929 /DNA_START=95 /DNA_END=1363 /DNA_ORIENTATION=- /assembly_acc=CAM_ASM_000159
MKFLPITVATVVATASSFTLLTSTSPVDGFSTVAQRPTTSASASRSSSYTSLSYASEEKVYIPEPVNDDGVFPKRPSPSSSSGRSYAEEEEFDTFISVEEAEERLRHERMQFDLDHEDMRRLIDEQRHELDELHHLAQHRGGGSSPVRVARDITDDVIDVKSQDDNDEDTNDDNESKSSPSSSRSIKNKNNAQSHRYSGPPPPSPQAHFGHPHHRPQQPHVRAPFMQPDTAFATGDSFGDPAPMASYHEAHIIDLERRLHLAMEENAMLVEQLHSQQHLFDDQRAELEQRIMEEQDRVLSLQEELVMERTYFEESRVELQDLVDTERARADRLQDELSIHEMQDQQRMFQHHQQHYQHQNGGNTRTHFTQSAHTATPPPPRGGGAGNGVYVGTTDPHASRQQGPQHFDVQLDNNDILSPLYP